MSPTLRWISARHLWEEKGRTALTLLGVALGVAVYVAIRLANHSAMASFRTTIDAVAGRANMQATGSAAGFDERVFPQLRAVAGVRAAAPVVQVMAPVRNLDNEVLLILGLDPFSEVGFGRYAPEAADRRAPLSSSPSPGSLGGGVGDAARFFTEPDAIAVTADLARRRGLKDGSTLEVLAGARVVRLRVRQILPARELQDAMAGNVAMMDIATAQEAFDRIGRVDRIDLIVDETQRGAVERRLRALLPGDVRLERPEARSIQVENMVRAFRLNLTALSCIALFVAMFLIFNAVSMAVMKRRREIGILRALGVTRRQVLGMFLLEAGVVGIGGTGIGLLLGIVMARTALHAVAQTITALYVAVRAREVVLAPDILAQGALLGMGAALVSAIWPARDAAATQPVTTIRQGLLAEPGRLPLGPWAALGAASLVAAAVVAWRSLAGSGTWLGFASAFLILAGFALMTPLLTVALNRACEGPSRRLFGIEGELALRYLTESLPRTAVIIAGLMVSVAMLIGLTVMVDSFRDTVNTWVNQTVKGDLYVETAGRAAGGSASGVPPAVIEAARKLPETAAVGTYSGQRIQYHGTTVGLGAMELDVLARHGNVLFREGRAAEILRRVKSSGGVAVTEGFERKHGATTGNTIVLDTALGPHSFRIFGVLYDYTTDAGGILIDRALYARLWKDPSVSSLAIYLRPGADPLAARRGLAESVGQRYALVITPNQSLRSHVMDVFDQTFRITYALQAVAIAVAVLGIFNTLTALTLQRGREIGVLRAVGAFRGQVRKMVLVEAGAVGALGAVIGSVCGIALALLLIYVINREFFGWSIRLRLQPLLFLQTLALMVVTSLVAGILPARYAASRLAAEAMRLE
jgi:putative ABC transport system permease protein